MTKRHHLLRWRPCAGDGLEHCEIEENPDGIIIESVLIGDTQGRRIGLSYRIDCAPDWTFRALDIRKPGADPWRLSCDASGLWTINDAVAPHLDGCIDIDLSGSPLTNTLPIRRAHLDPGVARRFDMAWVDLADLSVRSDGQIYTRIDAHRVRYQSANSDFEAMLALDDEGFVRDYPGLFTRLA